MPWEINKSGRAEIYALFFVYAKSPANRKWRIVVSLFDLIAWSVGVYPVRVSKVDKPDIESESEF